MSISVNTTTRHATCARQPLSFWGNIGQMIAVGRQRRQLLDLDAHLLADIGVTRSQALAEAQQTPWNAPAHWRK